MNRRNFFSRTFAAIAALWCGSKVKAEEGGALVPRHLEGGIAKSIKANRVGYGVYRKRFMEGSLSLDDVRKLRGV